MTKRLLWGGLITLLGIFILSELLLPYYIGRQVEAGLRKTFNSPDLRASVKASPAFSMLGGNFSAITVDGRNIHTEKLVIGQLSAVFTNTSIDMNRLLTGRSLVFRHVGGFDGTIVLREEDINQFMTAAVKGIKNVQVVLVPENMKVTGDLVFGPAVIGVSMEGKLRGDETRLKYKAEQLLVSNTAVGVNLTGSGFTDFVLFDMKKLPVAASVRDVIMEQGRVVIRIAK